MESRYPPLEKIVYYLVIASQKLCQYFQAHSIRVLTDQPLRQVLQKPEASGRLLKWAVELGQFDITYHLRTVIKGQALADFIVEGTNLEDPSYQSKNGNTKKEGDTPVWKLYVDGASNEHNSGAGIILITLENH